MAALRTDCFSVGHQFFWNNLLFIFLLEFYYPIFSLRSCRECTSAPPAVGHDAHRVLPKKNMTARDLTGKLSPPAQKKEARKGPGNRLNVRCAPKTRFLLPIEIYRKRDDNCDTVGIWFGPCWWNLLPLSFPCSHPRSAFLFLETIYRVF